MENFFKSNRKKLAKNLPENACAIFYSGNVKHKSGDEDFEFCVNKNFFYLTGLEKPNIFLILKKQNGKVLEQAFTPTYKKSVWVEPNYTIKQIEKISGMKEIFYYDETPNFEDKNLFLDAKNKDLLKYFENKKFEDVSIFVEALKAKKEKTEIDKIKKAIWVTKQGLFDVFEHLSKCKTEYNVQGIFEGKLKFLGTKDLAFASIVASGKNACTLHYQKNDSKLKNGDLLLLDVGAKYKHYSADISRTIPVSGKFSSLQKKFYNLVLNAQKYIIKNIKPNVTLKELNIKLVDYYFENIPKIDKSLVKQKQDVFKYFMHGVGHSLGLNTHDEGILANQKLKPGNIITCEPGIYIPKYKLGIRIEDDILVTKDGNVVLSKNIPKTISQLEKLLK